MGLIENISPGWLAYWYNRGRWNYPSHIALLDRILVAASIKRNPKRIIVNMPPRHGKSELISHYLPVWYLGHYPDDRVILTSYEATFAASFGRKVRDTIDRCGKELFDIEISPTSSSASSFDIKNRKGGMYCAGAGGPITGKGANLLIIDDPIKNDAEANSPVYRDNVWNWFKSTAFTRLEPNGIIILIMTRWNEDDLCGRIFQNEELVEASAELLDEVLFHNHSEQLLSSDAWLLVKIPAIAGSKDVLGRKEGEALWKGRFSIEALKEIKKTIGDYWFSALYQQVPAPLGGFIFKRNGFKYYEQDEDSYYLKQDYSNNNGNSKVWLKSDCKVLATVDLAVSKSQTADFTVIIVFAVTPRNEVLLLDVIRERFAPSEHMEILVKIQNRWRPEIIGIEKVQYQTALIQDALMAGMPIKELIPDSDKVTRALPMSARLESGTVFFPTQAHWLLEFENELLNFPNGKYDDQVDAFSYIYKMLQFVTGSLPVGKKANFISKSSLTYGF